MAFSISSAIMFILSVAIFTTLASADRNHLLPVDTMNDGAYLQEGRYTFIMQEDCNLVLYNLNRKEWESETSNEGSRCYVTLQSDGNLVIYDRSRSNQLIWSSNTGGQNGNYVLIVQEDGNVVIYSNPIFATGTNRIGDVDSHVSMKHIRKVITANL